MPDPAPLIVFSDDWGRHPSSCQHLIAKLLPHRRVTWVNQVGTRPPGLNWTTLTRGLGKLRQWVGLKKPAPPGPPSLKGRGEEGNSPLPFREGGPGGVGLSVLNPKMWPSFRSRF